MLKFGCHCYSIQQLLHIYFFKNHPHHQLIWAAGAMDSASDFGSEGSRFESWVARIFFLFFPFFVHFFSDDFLLFLLLLLLLLCFFAFTTPLLCSCVLASITFVVHSAVKPEPRYTVPGYHHITRHYPSNSVNPCLYHKPTICCRKNDYHVTHDGCDIDSGCVNLIGSSLPILSVYTINRAASFPTRPTGAQCTSTQLAG